MSLKNSKEQLKELSKVDGVKAVVLLSRDGFIIDNSIVGKFDAESLGAVISTSTGAAGMLGQNLELGEFSQSLQEFKNGVVLVTLASDLIIAAVADPSVNLGALRYQAKKVAPEIARAL